MSDLYDALHEKVSELRDAGFEPDRIVVPGEDWNGVKEQAEVVEDSEVFGGKKTLLNGVRVLHNSPLGSARVSFEVDGGPDES